MKPHLWLRTETKANEARCPLTPKNAKKLIEAGFKISIEQFPSRIFREEDYYEVGCEIVKEHTWVNAPQDVIILGLKELPENEDFALIHRHIFFAHVFKGQTGSIELLKRFKDGNGKLFDLEYLTDEHGRRISAFGKWAGYVGAAIGIDRFFHKQDKSNSIYPQLRAYSDKEILIKQILNNKLVANNKDPKVIIIGAKGRCGSGSIELLRDIGIEFQTSWDRSDTDKGGPFQEIINHDVFINTVLVTTKVPPFIDRYTLNKNNKLKVIADISCDPTSSLNPIPLYHSISSWEKPFILDSDSDVEILAVDNLPSILPKESSVDFSDQLYPYLLDLLDKEASMHEAPVWRNAYSSFTQVMNSYFK